MARGKTLHIIEVKYRSLSTDIVNSIHPGQLARLHAQASLYQRQYSSHNIQIDALFITPKYPFIHHVENITDHVKLNLKK